MCSKFKYLHMLKLKTLLSKEILLELRNIFILQQCFQMYAAMATKCFQLLKGLQNKVTGILFSKIN